MPDIACTQKLAKEFRELYTPEIYEADGLRGWHANLVLFKRRKCILLTNDATRFTLFFAGLRKPDFQNFQQLFTDRFVEELQWLNLPPAKIAQAKLLLGPFRYGKTYSKSTLGTQRDMKVQIEAYLMTGSSVDFANINYRFFSDRLNDMPCHSKDHAGYFYPREEMVRLVSSL